MAKVVDIPENTITFQDNIGGIVNVRINPGRYSMSKTSDEFTIESTNEDIEPDRQEFLGSLSGSNGKILMMTPESLSINISVPVRDQYNLYGGLNVHSNIYTYALIDFVSEESSSPVSAPTSNLQSSLDVLMSLKSVNPSLYNSLSQGIQCSIDSAVKAMRESR